MSALLMRKGLSVREGNKLARDIMRGSCLGVGSEDGEILLSNYFLFHYIRFSL